jgi:acyl dehydratase
MVLYHPGRIDAFAGCTEDRQWIHVDRERAAQVDHPWRLPEFFITDVNDIKYFEAY